MPAVTSELELADIPSALRVHVPNNGVLGIWVIKIVVQVWGKYTFIGYLDP